MIGRLAARNMMDRPWRSALLLAGYAVGVAVMIVLLAVGEALLIQARDERLIGGGSITVLPEGLDVEVMKTGGLGGMFFSIDRARFVRHQVLASPRLADAVTTVAPQIDGKLLYLRARGREYAVRANGEIPSASAALGASRPLVEGTWIDDEGDRRWMAPTPAELAHEIDRFHEIPGEVRDRESWAEWHYANVIWRDGRRWAFLTWMIGGDIEAGTGGGQVLVTIRDQEGGERRYRSVAGAGAVERSTTRADVRVGSSFVRVREDGAYVLHAVAMENAGAGATRIDLVLDPENRAYFPAAELGSGEFSSGYAVAGLRATASGTICENGRCDHIRDAPAYKDHNWGTWRGVTWEWGAARAGSLGILYGRVMPADANRQTPLFVYLVDSLGFRALFRPRAIAYEDDREIRVGAARVPVPVRARMSDVRGDDTLVVELDIEDATGTDVRAGAGGAFTDTSLSRPYFIQMKGTARVRGRAGGAPFDGSGLGFFETFRGATPPATSPRRR